MFKDHFSPLATQYARHRPDYPAELFAELAALTPARRCAWDCATGTGQAARGLALYFDAVCASDLSAAQLGGATAAGNVIFVRAAAERAPLRPGGCDLVTVAQALHWFDLSAFYAEARRVLAPGGVLAVWSYPLLRVTAAVDALLDSFYAQTLGPYWPAERRHVEAGYRDLPFPFAELDVGRHDMKVLWRLEDLLGYLTTWSALAIYRERTGEDPWPAMARRLAAVWGPEEQQHPVRWPLQLRVGRRD